MQIKVEGFVQLDGAKGLRIDLTKTHWGDLPYQDENGEWHNKGKQFTVAFEWDDDPIKLGEMLDVSLQSIFKYAYSEGEAK